MTCHSEIIALGREQSVFLKKEASCEVYQKPITTDAIRVRHCHIGFDQERVFRTDKDARTRSRRSRISRRQTMPWDIETYFDPSGVAGTPPDIGVLLEAAFGTESIGYGPGTVTYSLLNSQQLHSLQLVSDVSYATQQLLQAAKINEWTISGSGGDEVICSFSGDGQAYAAGHRTHWGTTDGINTYVTLDSADDIELWDANILIQFLLADGTYDNNTGAGYRVTSVVAATGRLNLDAVPDAHTTLPVLTYVPAETVVENAAVGIIGSVKIDTVSVPVTAWSVTVRNNIKVHNDEFGETGPTAQITGLRDVEGSLTVRLWRDQAIQYARARTFTSRDLEIIFGSDTAGGYRGTLAMGNIEFNIPDIDPPEDEEVEMEFAFVAMKDAANEDEMTLVID